MTKTEIIPIASEICVILCFCYFLLYEQLYFPTKNLAVIIGASLSIIEAACECIFHQSQSRMTLPVSLATKILMSAFSLSRLDYCDFLLVDLPNRLLGKLQRARIMLLVLPAKGMLHPLFPELHWLPAAAHLHYKMVALFYRCLHGLASSLPV